MNLDGLLASCAPTQARMWACFTATPLYSSTGFKTRSSADEYATSSLQPLEMGSLRIVEAEQERHSGGTNSSRLPSEPSS